MNPLACLLVSTILLAQEPAEPPAKFATARATMRTFLEATDQRKYAEASQALEFPPQLDLSRPNEQLTPLDRDNHAWMLREVLDRLGVVDVNSLSGEPHASPWRFPTDAADPPIVLARQGDGAWRFAAETVQRLPVLYQSLKDEPRYVDRGLLRLRVPYLRQEVWQLLAFAASVIGGLVLGWLVRMLLNRWAVSLEKRDRQLAAVASAALARSIAVALMTIGLAMGVEFLDLPPSVAGWVSKLTSSLVAAAVGYIVWCLVDVVSRWLMGLSSRTDGRLDEMLVLLVTKSLRTAVVVMTLVQVATIWSEAPVTSLIAGLGIGGLAIGLAAQDTIKNLFGSVMIFSDRPFELGDRILIDGREGPVETVGFRSTRIRMLEGVLTIPNADLANKPILNLGKATFLKRSANIHLSTATPPEKIERALAILRELLSDYEGLPPGRPASISFNEITDHAFNLAVLYYFAPPDLSRFNAFTERFHLELLRRFQSEEIELATPATPLRPEPPGKAV